MRKIVGKYAVAFECAAAGRPGAAHAAYAAYCHPAFEHGVKVVGIPSVFVAFVSHDLRLVLATVGFMLVFRSLRESIRAFGASSARQTG